MEGKRSFEKLVPSQNILRAQSAELIGELTWIVLFHATAFHSTRFFHFLILRWLRQRRWWWLHSKQKPELFKEFCFCWKNQFAKLFSGLYRASGCKITTSCGPYEYWWWQTNGHKQTALPWWTRTRTIWPRQDMHQYSRLITTSPRTNNKNERTDEWTEWYAGHQVPL